MSEIIPLPEEEARTLWNEFILSVSTVVPFSFNPSFFDFYKEYFHWKPFYFFLYHEEKLTAVFPLIYTGKNYVSLPHFSYGGLLTNQSISDISNVIKRLAAQVDKTRLASGFYRYNLPLTVTKENESFQLSLFLRGLNSSGSMSASEKVTSSMELGRTKEELWDRLSSNLRRKVRKAERSGITYLQGDEELLNDFYKVYVRKMHQLGSPPYGKGFFRMFFHPLLKEGSRFFVAYSAGQQPIGAAILLSYHGFYESAWFATDYAFHKYYVSDGLHWSIIKHVINKGGRIYSMGRSTKKSNVYIYKNHWPVKNNPLFIYDTSNRSFIKKHMWLSKLWRQFPLPVANWLGPMLVKHIY